MLKVPRSTASHPESPPRLTRPIPARSVSEDRAGSPLKPVHSVVSCLIADTGFLAVGFCWGSVFHRRTGRISFRCRAPERAISTAHREMGRRFLPLSGPLQFDRAVEHAPKASASSNNIHSVAEYRPAPDIAVPFRPRIVLIDWRTMKDSAAACTVFAPPSALNPSATLLDSGVKGPVDGLHIPGGRGIGMRGGAVSHMSRTSSGVRP
jgi:hypothetical protein